MKNRSIKSIILSLSTIAILATSPLAKAGPTVTIEATNIDTLIVELTGIAQQLAPQAPTAMLPSMLGMAIKNPGLVGIDRTKPVQLQIFLPEKQPTFNTEPAISLHIPLLENGKHYLALLEQSIGKPVKKDDIMAFTPATGDSLYVKIDDDYAIISDNEKSVRIAEDISSDTLLDITGTVRIGITTKELIPYLKLSKTEMANAIKNQPANPAMPMDAEKVLNTEINALIAILEQIDAMAIGIKINKSTIDISSRINPVKGSTIANLNKSLKTPAAKYATLAPADALYAVSGSGMASFDLLIEPYSKLITEIYGAMGPDFSKLAPALTKMITEYKGIYSGDFAMGIIPDGKGIGFYEAFALKDAAKAKTIMDKQLSTYNESFGKAMGMTIKTSPDRTYKNMKITGISYNVGDKMMDMPTPELTKNMLNKLTGELAYIGNSMLYTIGGAEVMNKLIDRLTLKKAATSTSAQFKKLIPNLKEEPVEFYTLSIAGIIKTLLLISPDVNETMLAGSSATGGIAGYATVDDYDRMSLDRISIDEIIAIKDLAPTIQATLAKLIMSPKMQMHVAPSTPPAN